jgi:hypothetical protein
MSHYTAGITWERNGATFTDNRYSRAHRWHFDGGIEVPASASPQVVPLPLSVAEAVDPEEAFVAALASCRPGLSMSRGRARGPAQGSAIRRTPCWWRYSRVSGSPRRGQCRRQAPSARQTGGGVP